MSAETLKTLTTLWAKQGLSPSKLEAREDGTILASERRGLAESQTLYVDDANGEALTLSPEAFELKELLGQGGMGQVRLADQPTLRRQVAVKTTFGDENRGAVAALLKEAWVGGCLEHPNVVPVHALGRSGPLPAMVMKRVEGRSWDVVLEEGTPHADLGGHLDVFVQVCHAVHYAHTRGILHLDLKPENIMIGEFGEVYVLDWGLAASFGDEGPTWLKAAAELTGIAGTPGYMAPELVVADAAAIGPRTDVYLLGAVLHHVITGGPLHEGETVMLQLSNAFSSIPPDYGPEVPAELASIVRRATHRDPQERFASVEALRETVEGFLHHRGADRAVALAEQTLEELHTALRPGASAVDLEPRFAECELALEQARRAWDEHPRLAPLQTQLLAGRFEHAMLQRQPDAAKAALDRMEDPPPEFQERLTQLRHDLDERERRVARLEDMSRELDVTLGRQDRRIVFLSLGAIWAVVNITFGWLGRSGIYVIDYEELLAEGVAMVAAFVPLGWVRRRVLFQNLANRKLYGGFIFTAVAVELFWAAGYKLGIPVLDAVSLTPLFYTYAFATLAIVLDRRFWWGALALACAAMTAGLTEAWTYDVIGVGGLVAVVATSWAWRE
ncbi:MAG: serine/threonine-protein kinase [Myxococcota bacterium]